ncbi:hypothetical protein [Enterobacter cloacae]|uniref:hypothetical protein n=1 Tax=Enterobacter cloacae TaxID=550 RepID=UPI001F23CFF0|nr:hypothetical protein [Enterobacter cloacae]
MSNINKQAVTAKTKELASLMVERISMNPVSCKLLNEAWKKEFPDEVAIAARMLALLDELEKMQAQSSKWCEAFHKAVSVGARYEERIAELSQKADIYDMLRQDYGLQGSLVDFVDWQAKRIAELSHHLQSAHAFIEHTEAFGHEASNGILCCGDAQWNIDASKSALAATGKGE